MFFFFFKQKTAYEMRISDWSSDVCSSDLQATDEAELLADDGEHEVGVGLGQEAPLGPAGAEPGAGHAAGGDADEGLDGLVAGVAGVLPRVEEAGDPGPAVVGRQGERGRSEERRVGKEGVGTCRSRWSPSN